MAEEAKVLPSHDDKVEADEKKGESKVAITLDAEEEEVLAKGPEGVPPVIPEVKKDPKTEQNNISPDNPRFKEVYGQLKTQQRENTKLIERLGERDKLFESVQAHQKDLTEAILKIEQGREVREEKKEHNTVLGGLNAAASKLNEDIASAHTEGKVDEAMRLSDKLVETKIAISKAEEASKVEHKEPETKTQVQTNDADPDNTKAVAIVQSKHTWLGGDSQNDKAMTAMAVSLDAAFRVDPAYKDTSLEERYEDVVQLVEERFGMSKDEGNKGPGEKSSTDTKHQISVADVEEGSDGFSQKSGTGREVVLNADQREIARAMGVTEEAYAKQVYIINAQKGDR